MVPITKSTAPARAFVLRMPDKAGMLIPTSSAMIAITVSNSTKVKPALSWENRIVGEE